MWHRHLAGHGNSPEFDALTGQVLAPRPSTVSSMALGLPVSGLVLGRERRVRGFLRGFFNEHCVIWRFPEIGVPPNHHLFIICSILNHPIGGTSILGNLHMRTKNLFSHWTLSVCGCDCWEADFEHFYPHQRELALNTTNTIYQDLQSDPFEMVKWPLLGLFVTLNWWLKRSLWRPRYRD